MAHPSRSSGPKRRAVRRSPTAPRRQAPASKLGRNRSAHPAVMTANPPSSSPDRGASRLPSSPPRTPATTMAAIRQGRVRVQAAHSAARARRQVAWAEPPGRPTVARTRTATIGRSALVPARRPSGSSARWARIASRSVWLSGRTEPLGRSSSQGHDRELAIGASFLLVLAGGPLWASPATLVVRSRLVGTLAGRLGVAAAVGGALLGMDPLDGRVGPLAVGPLGRVVRLSAERPVGVSNVVAAPVLFDLGGGVAPGPPAPGRVGHRAQGLQDIAGAVGFDRQPGGAPLPGQGPHNLAVGWAEMGVGFQPAVAALLVLAKFALAVVG